MSDYLLGGKANFTVDREVVDYVTAALPGGADAARTAADSRRAFTARALAYLASEAGIDQFICVGTNMPTIDTLQKVVQDVVPSGLVVYVIDDDLLTPPADLSRRAARDDKAAYIRASPGRADTILSQTVDMLDLAEPVAVVLHGIVTGLADDDARRFVSELLADLVAGSYMALVHWANDLYKDATATMWQRTRQLVDEGRMQPIYPRSHAEVCSFFDGLEVLQPGVVPVENWRPSPQTPAPPRGARAAAYAGVGRKRG
jgi:hypothetical protein